MAIDNQNVQDPTTQGVRGLRGLEGINRLRDRGINIDASILTLAKDYKGTMAEINQATSPRQDVGFVGVGDSMFDERITSATQLDNLANTRGELQPWYAQIGAGLTKGAILAGTTFLDGTVGLVLGAGHAVKEGRFSALWDNDFSKAMKSVNEWSEQALPNYYTDAERNEPWYENIFTANFLGDKFIKNLGFTVGAFYSGGVTAAGLKATKLPQIIGAVAKSSKAPAIITSGVGATISAVNEGRIEALNNSTDWFELQKAQLDDQHNARLQALEQYRGTEMYYPLIAQENANYEATIGKLTEDRLKMGNADLLMNIPILTASNLIQFGRLYANGYKTARKATNIIGKAGEYATEKTAGKGIAKSLLSPLSEGTEELAQKAASVVSGVHYEDDVNNFYKAKIDPEAEQETLSWIKSFAEGINQTVNDGSSWEEFFIGTLTGALGMPRFRGIRSSEGNLQSPVTFEGGTLGEYREYRDQMNRETEIANYMNNRVSSSEFINYYQGLIRHNKYQRDMNQAVENKDEFEFKNAEHAQLISDIVMFDNAGKLEDLVTLVNSAFDTSDENLASIVENTTSTLEDGSKVGPFVDKNGNPMYSTPEGRQEMIDKLTQTKDEMLNAITNYTKIKDDIDIRTGQQLSDEQLQELTWLKSQITNWQDRASQLSSEVKPTIDTVLGSMSQLANMYNAIKTEEGKNHAGLTDLYKNADNTERQLRKSMSVLETVRSLDDKTFAYLLSSDPKLVKGIKSVLNDPLSGVSADEIQTIESKIDDIVKLVGATDNFNTKLREYLENPGKLQEDMTSATEAVATEEVKKKSNSLKDKLISSTNLSEFKQALSTEGDVIIREETLKSLEEEGNQLAKNYREVNAYNTDVQRAINSLDEDPAIKADALKLLQDQFENSSTLEEIANPNSIYVDNADAIYDDSLSPEENTRRFQEAQYALLRAMNQINNDNRFKDRFSQDYRVLREKGKPSSNTPKKDTTGDSGTPTIPPVNGDTLPPVTYEPPIGNTTATQISDENKQLNDRVTTPDVLDAKQSGRRPYYRPSIPELHIQASKEGDFRPFNIVVAEREKGANFDDIYNYLRDNGAFTYINEGNIKAGDELAFMIDPEFNDHTIFIVDRRNGQIVGSLDESDYSVDRYEGLKSLEEKIRQEFSQVEDKTKKFIATPTTRVSQVMVGRIPYGKEERSLANIPNVSSEGRAPIFGIIKNGVLSTNGRLDDGVVIKPVDMAQKEGRMYLLIPNAAGKYSPAAVRVKHFNRSEFNPEDITVQGTTVFNNIQEAINALANSLSEDDLNNAVRLLKQNIYTGELHIDWFTSDAGNGIRFTKVQRDTQGNEVYEYRNGQRVRKEVVKTVFLTEKWDQNTLFSITGSNDVQTGPASKSIEEVAKEVTNILLDFNLPIQVNLGMLNRGGYNNMLINSGILTSNITDARVVSSWFTTDYFDINGNLQRAVNPVSVTPDTRRGNSPVGGNEGVENGTQITVGNTVYYVDLAQSIITDANGNRRGMTATDGLLVDLAWAQDNFGNATQSSMMVDNKVVTPSGRVLDRGTQRYLSGEEAQRVKDKIAGRERTTVDTKKVIAQIEENQRKVDKTRTDGEYYYILEEDGQHHEYERVHSRLGSNWVESKKQADALRYTRIKLSQLVDNATQYNNYLANLSKHYGVDLATYSGKTDAKSRDAIISIIRDKMAGTNSQRALNAGTSVDSVIRNFFTSNDTPTKPDNMSERAFTDLLTSLTEIKSNIEARGERFLTNNIVLFQKYHDGTRVAGEVDILSVDADGNFRIYDVKTSRYSFYDFIDRYGHPANYFKNKSATQRMSAYDYYTLQLSAYKNLFESQYNTPITTLAILPFVLSYNKDIVDAVGKEKGIMITYNPAVNVHLVSAVKANPVTPTNSAVPVFNSANETLDPINDVLPEFNLENSKVGYFIVDGKLHKGYMSPIGQVNGIEVYMTKVPNISSGFGRPGEQAHIASNSYMAVFPNGNTIMLIKNDPLTMSEQQAKDAILGKLNGNPQRVSDMSNEKTLIFDPANAVVIEPARFESSSTILDQSPNTGASKAVIAEKAINEHDDEFEDELKLRESTDIKTTIWDKEKELSWLNKVLPQLSKEDRVKVVNGLIKVANKGTVAWGMLDKGIVTLSDIAAEGTTYHEAFHVVFNLLLDPKERQSLLDEARKIYGEKDNISLEEDMAEGFREYVMSRDSRGLGRRILDFFKELLAKITNWKYLKPNLYSYYRMINEGKYIKESLRDSNTTNLREEEYSQEMQSIKDQAIANGTFMKAPNGKPTNLTERQWLQVRTDAFKNWFGDWENDAANASKVVDENGEPKVVYHGSPKKDIEIFDSSKSDRKAEGTLTSSLSDKMNFFTDDDFTVQAYAEYEYEGKNAFGKIYDIFLNIRNPKTLNYNGRNWTGEGFKAEYFDLLDDSWLPLKTEEGLEFFPTEQDAVKAARKEIVGAIDNSNFRYTKTNDFQVTNLEVEKAIKEGYDGVIIKNVAEVGQGSPFGSLFSNDYVTFNTPNQIKSATDNVGTFSRDNDDIRYRKIPNTSFETIDSNIKELLMKKGWTQEKFDSISQQERDYATRCASI